MNARIDVREWTDWKIDVRGEDDITMFVYPFDELRTRKASLA
jgi:hypothetical protein